MLLIPISSSQAPSILWNSYPQLYEYLDTEEKDNEQPVYWEQYYSDIEHYNDEKDDESSNDKFSRQLQETNVPESRDKRMRQVILIHYIYIFKVILCTYYSFGKTGYLRSDKTKRTL